MSIKHRVEWSLRGTAALAGIAAMSYAGFVGASWLRYGHAAASAPDEADPLLDVFMPKYDVAERHHIAVAASAEATFGALMDMDLEQSRLVHAIFKGRQLLMGAEADAGTSGRSLVEVTKELGWVVLAEMPGHEIVMGAVTRPWEPNVVFRGIPPDAFAAFDEPDYVKIVWTLRVDPVRPYSSIARFGNARGRDRCIRAPEVPVVLGRFSAGIVLIRELSMRLVKKEAERRAQSVGQSA